MHNADQGLTGTQRTDHGRADRLFLYGRDKILDHRQGHIGLEQGQAHLTQHVGHIGFGDAGLPPDFLDEAAEFVGKGGGHRDIPADGTKVGGQRQIDTMQNAKLYP